MDIRTKIICTMGPAVNSYDTIKELITAGMNVARINFSHGTYEEHEHTIAMLKKAREELQCPLGIMLDTKGPEVRIGDLKEDVITLNPGQEWRLINEQIEGTTEEVTVTPATILNQLDVGTTVLFNDGYIVSKVKKKQKNAVTVEIQNGGVISSRRGINVPNVDLDLPLVTEKDIEDVLFGCKLGIDIIAASFVRLPETVIEIRKLIDEQGKNGTLIIAKIENHSGIVNFDNILQVSDGIMIARGDLGVEIPLADVPRLQKMMIRKCYLAGKTSVTATQMLESMIRNQRPTRAEVSDVANAIYDSTSAVMLSGETAIGRYPVETVQLMCNIIQKAEADIDYESVSERHVGEVYTDVSFSLTMAAVKTAYSAKALAIIAFTSSGNTARLIARIRPCMPIIAMTHLEKAFHQMALYWGVVPVLNVKTNTIEESFEKVTEIILQKELLSHGDLVVITAGSPFGVTGTTNMMIVEKVGKRVEYNPTVSS